MLVKQLSVFVENKSGRVAEVTGILEQNAINIRAMSLADTTNFGILRLIVDDPDRAEQVLKQMGITVSLTSVLAISVDDRPGGLGHVLKSLRDNGIGVEYIYAVGILSGRAVIVIRVDDNEKALDLMEKTGVKTVSGDEVYHIK